MLIYMYNNEKQNTFGRCFGIYIIGRKFNVNCLQTHTHSSSWADREISTGSEVMMNILSDAIPYHSNSNHVSFSVSSNNDDECTQKKAFLHKFKIYNDWNKEVGSFINSR